MIERVLWIALALVSFWGGYRRGRSWWIRVFDQPISHDETRIIHGLEKSVEPNRPRLRFEPKPTDRPEP